MSSNRRTEEGEAVPLIGRSARIVALLVPVVLLGTPSPASADVAMTQLSADPFSNADSQHRTEVGSDTFQSGTTIFTAFQAGRGSGGSAGVGYASYDKRAGVWRRTGFLDGITVHRGGGVYGAVSNVKVAYCFNCYDIWLISSLAINGPGGSSAIITSRTNNNGYSFSKPVTAVTGQIAGNWLVCNYHPSGPCYLGYTLTNAGNAIRMRVTTNGGLTWGPERGTADNASGFAGKPVVQRDGTVVVPYLATSGQIRTFRSNDRGESWQSSVPVSNVQRHNTAGGLHTNALPSAQRDYYGTTYVAWSDCRFRTGCAANDIVWSKSTNATSWSAPRRVPIAAGTSTVDAFLPGIGVDPNSFTAETTRVGLTYYYYPDTNCTFASCQLNVGFISSVNGGTTWSAPTRIAGPMNLSWLPDSRNGRTVGDSFATEVAWGGNAFPIVSIASAPTGGNLNQAMYAPSGGLPITGG
jgi:hypothetical protein